LQIIHFALIRLLLKTGLNWWDSAMKILLPAIICQCFYGLMKDYLITNKSMEIGIPWTTEIINH